MRGKAVFGDAHGFFRRQADIHYQRPSFFSFSSNSVCNYQQTDLVLVVAKQMCVPAEIRHCLSSSHSEFTG